MKTNQIVLIFSCLLCARHANVCSNGNLQISRLEDTCVEPQNYFNRLVLTPKHIVASDDYAFTMADDILPPPIAKT